MERNVNTVKDVNGNNIVIINDIRFKGKRSVKWDDVRYIERLDYCIDIDEYAEQVSNLKILLISCMYRTTGGIVQQLIWSY